MALAAGPIIDMNQSYGIALFTFCTAIAGVFSIVIEEDLRRFKFTEKKLSVNIDSNAESMQFVKDYKDGL